MDGLRGGSTQATMLGRNRLWEMWERWEALRKQNDQWTCFLCCHVRTGTIIIGIWYMLLHLAVLSFITVVIVNPDILRQPGLATTEEQLEVNSQDVQATNCAQMPCILAKQSDESTDTNKIISYVSLLLGNIISHPLNTDEPNVALFFQLCMFIVTSLFVYGAFCHQPSHLMPFFFLQVFNFCISSMTMIGYLSYLPNIRQLILESPPFLLQKQLLAMNTKCLTFFVMLIFISTLMAKAYCISIVWRCYKYLMVKVQTRRSGLRYLGGVTGPVDQESQTLVMGQDLPDYDTAITDPQYRKKLSGMFPEPPPSYDMAMAALYGQREATRERGEAAELSDAAAALQPAPENQPATSAEGAQALPPATHLGSTTTA